MITAAAIYAPTASDDARTPTQVANVAPTCRAGRRIDTGQAPTFEHTDDWSVCDHGRDVPVTL